MLPAVLAAQTMKNITQLCTKLHIIVCLQPSQHKDVAQQWSKYETAVARPFFINWTKYLKQVWSRILTFFISLQWMSLLDRDYFHQRKQILLKHFHFDWHLICLHWVQIEPNTLHLRALSKQPFKAAALTAEPMIKCHGPSHSHGMANTLKIIGAVRTSSG